MPFPYTFPFDFEAAYWFGIDWDNDSNFSEAIEDITAYVMSTTIQRERNDDLGQMQAGTCELVLRNASPDGSNPDDDYRFTPRNTLSPLYPIKAGIKCQITLDFGGSLNYLFTGYLDRPTVDHEARTATLYFVEDFKRWGQMPISTALLESQRAPTILAAILAAVGYTGSVVADAGADVIPYAGWYDTPAMNAIRELEEAEQCTIYIDGQGRVRPRAAGGLRGVAGPAGRAAQHPAGKGRVEFTPTGGWTPKGKEKLE